MGEIDIHICVYQRYPDIITFGIDADDDKIFRPADRMFSLRRYSIFWVKFHSNESARYANTSSLAPLSLAMLRSSILWLVGL